MRNGEDKDCRIFYMKNNKTSLSLYSKIKCLIGLSADSGINQSKPTSWHAIRDESVLIEKLPPILKRLKYFN